MSLNPAEAQKPLSPGAEKTWNESQFVWWIDFASGLAGFHRIAHQPNRCNAHVWNCVLRSDGTRFRRSDPAVPFDPGSREGGRYRTERLELWHHGRGGVHVRSDYPGCAVDLEIDDLYPAVNLSELHGKRDTYNQGEERIEAHFECAGRVTGRVTLDGRTSLIDAYGYRDHSWGPRNVGKIQSSMWATGTTGELSFMFSRSVVQGMPPFTMGYIAERGAVKRVVDVDLVYWLEFDGVTYREARGLVTAEDGARYEVRFYEAMGGVIVALDGWLGFEAASRISVNGREGVGNCERNINPCGGDRLPEFTVHATTAEGLTRPLTSQD